MPSTYQVVKHTLDNLASSTMEKISVNEAKQIGDALGIRWDKFDVEQFTMGVNVELEHGRKDPATDVTHDEPTVTGKIALAHLNEFPDYYTRLAAMENEAKLFYSQSHRENV